MSVFVRDFDRDAFNGQTLAQSGLVFCKTPAVEVYTRPACFSIKFTFEGQESYATHGRVITMRGGDIAIVGPTALMESGIARNQFADGASIFLSGIKLPQLVNADAEGFLECSRYISEKFAGFIGPLRTLAEGPDKEASAARLFEALRAQLAVYLDDIFIITRGLPAHRRVTRQRQAVRLIAAKAALRSAACESVSVEEIAACHGFTRSQFSRLFNTAFGCSPGQFRNAIKMEKARAMVLQSDLPLAEIAERLTFADYPTFSKAFRRFHALPPSQMRIGTN